MPDLSKARKRFVRMGSITLFAVFFLILVGGIVRSTGSGMGCPDWPKCFGSWVPPTHISQLPDDYLEVYKNQRIEKNKRFATYLSKVGFTEVGEYIFSHPASFIETDFNATKTWIEYVNRLVGATIGILIFLTVLYALPLRKADKTIFWLAFWSFLVVGFQGWLGSIVVSTNLMPEMVTIHMAFALVLIALLVYAIMRADERPFLNQNYSVSGGLMAAIIGINLITFVQIIIGTQVREAVDMVAFNMNYQGRELWIDQLDGSFSFHRFFSLFIVAINVYVAIKLFELKNQRLRTWTICMLAVIFLEIVAGVVLSQAALPPFLQPVHLLLGTLLFGVQFYIFMMYFYAGKKKAAKILVTA